MSPDVRKHSYFYIFQSDQTQNAKRTDFFSCDKAVLIQLDTVSKVKYDTSYVFRTAAVRFAAFLRQPCDKAHGNLAVVLRLS